MEGRIPSTVYNVVKDGEYKGEIKVGLTFTPEVLLVVKLVLFPGQITVEAFRKRYMSQF